MNKPMLAGLSTALLVATLAACDKGPAPQASAGGPEATAIPKEAKEIYTQRCAMCHGASGRGDGPTGVALMPRPRDFTDKAWQGAVMDDQMAKTIVQGGAAVGKSPLMAPNADLAGKPQVVAGLIQIIHNFGK